MHFLEGTAAILRHLPGMSARLFLEAFTGPRDVRFPVDKPRGPLAEHIVLEASGGQKPAP
jgi:hypothetical protein